MAINQRGQRPTRAKVGSRAAGGLRRTALVVGAVGLTAGTGLFTAGSALASASIEPGNLVFSPANGSGSGIVSWHTADGCPAGYRQSAQVSLFTTGGTFLSRISPVVGGNLSGPFSGTLDGTLSAITRYAQTSAPTTVKPGGQLLFAVGCYSQVSGTGNVQWMQSAVITPSSDNKSYSTGAGSAPSTFTGPGVAGTLKSASGGQTESVPITVTNGGNPLEAALIAAACGLAVAGGGVVWYRRRQNRSRLV